VSVVRKTGTGACAGLEISFVRSANFTNFRQAPLPEFLLEMKLFS
jgi:hypothetical protein